MHYVGLPVHVKTTMNCSAGSGYSEDGDCNEPQRWFPEDCVPDDREVPGTPARGTPDAYNARDIGDIVPGSQSGERTLNCVQGARRRPIAVCARNAPACSSSPASQLDVTRTAMAIGYYYREPSKTVPMTHRAQRIGTPRLWMLAGLCFAMAVVAYACKDSKRSCTDDTGTHQDGETWQCSDGCNACSCHDGTMSTTAKFCIRDAGL